MAYKPVDTAIIMVVGTCIDDADFKTVEEAIAYDAAGMDVSLIVEKTDGTTAVTAISLTSGGVNDWVHVDGGNYSVEITAAQNIEEGVGFVRGICTGVLAFESPRYDIVKANIYDSIIKGTDLLQVEIAATGADAILKDSTFALAMADAIWDEILSGVTHNIATSAGRRLREVGAYAIHSGTAQAGNVVKITLAAIASAIDGTYNRNLIVLTSGTGVGQTRTIIDYDGSTKIAIVDREWRTNPDATSEYQVVPDDTPLVVDQGIAQAGSTLSTIKLRAYASSTNDIYLCNIVIIVAGAGRGQARLVGGYNGSTKVITLCGDDWTTTPDDTSVYVMIPYGATCVSCVGDDALAQIKSEADDALTGYDPPTRTEATSDKDAIITEVNANETKIDTLQTNSTAIKAKTDNLPSGIAKNVALSNFGFYMVLSSDHVTAATGKTIAGTISKAGGAFASLTNAISEIANGMYKVDLTQAEMNADVVTLKFTETDCDQRIITIYTS